MELKQIKELMAAMERAGIKKLSVKEQSGFELQMERQEDASHSAAAAASYPSHSFLSREIEPHLREQTVSHHLPRMPAPVSEAPEKKEEKTEGKFVTSPMVGTLYSTPSPDEPPFVKVGDKVDENTVVCIIEAMKVMNEVKAGISGIVAEVCIQNAHPVEFGTKILRIV